MYISGYVIFNCIGCKTSVISDRAINDGVPHIVVAYRNYTTATITIDGSLSG